MGNRVITNISTAYWCTSKGKFEKAVLRSKRDKGSRIEKTAWFDMLFEGGIVLPTLDKGKQRALTMLLTGPPGSGKSTLALELCHRLCKKDPGGNEDRLNEKPWSSLYFTSETNYSWAKQKAKSFNWEEFPVSLKKEKVADSTPLPLCEIWEVSGFKKYYQGTTSLIELIGAISGFFTKVDASPLVKALLDRWKKSKLKKGLSDKPDVVIIDSLNTVDEPRQSELFDAFTSIIENGPRILIIIIESDSTQNRAKYWEYLSDVVIRLDKHNISGYSTRTIEVLKARYQSHILGKHQLKIYPPTILKTLKNGEEKQAHPYREEGGIFIYPSIHYHMSIYKRYKSQKPPKVKFFHSPIKSLDTILHGGFPFGRCIGLIGVRGGHKSHLAYHTLLNQIITSNDNNQRGLIISLRDDEDIAKSTMSKILDQDAKLKNHTVEGLIEDDKLEILYYPPGYITPEEFFHRMFMSIHRLKFNGPKKSNQDNDVTVIFNSLDQLSSRFPLCAEEDIFIPGIIKALTVENVTSFFIGVDEPGQPQEQYGLLSMADALFSFTRETLPKNNFIGHIIESYKEELRQSGEIGEESILTEIEAKSNPANEKLPSIIQTVSLRIVRYAGGQAAGAGGILELVNEDSAISDFFSQGGLQFIPFSHLYNESTTEPPNPGFVAD